MRVEDRGCPQWMEPGQLLKGFHPGSSLHSHSMVYNTQWDGQAREILQTCTWLRAAGYEQRSTLSATSPGHSVVGSKWNHAWQVDSALSKSVNKSINYYLNIGLFYLILLSNPYISICMFISCLSWAVGSSGQTFGLTHWGGPIILCNTCHLLSKELGYLNNNNCGSWARLYVEHFICTISCLPLS